MHTHVCVCIGCWVAAGTITISTQYQELIIEKYTHCQFAKLITELYNTIEIINSIIFIL